MQLMERLCDAVARIRLGPTDEEIERLTDQLSRLHITARLQCPICGKPNVRRDNFWRHRRGKACMQRRAQLYLQINAGHDAMRAIITSEAIAKSRK